MKLDIIKKKIEVGDVVIPLEYSKVSNAVEQDVFLHPITNNPVEDWQEKVGFFLTVNKNIEF